MFPWVEDIRDLSRLKKARLEGWDETVPLEQQPAAFAEPHRALKTKLSERQARCEAHRQDPDLHVAKQTVLSSLHHHWDGLTVFAGCPAVAMEKNTAERRLRPPVVGRKNYEGSGRVWSAYLAAMMLSVRQTILRWGLNPHHGLSAFLEACADHGGQSPTDLGAFWPWQMTPERRAELSRPVAVRGPSVALQTQEPGGPEAAATS